MKVIGHEKEKTLIKKYLHKNYDSLSLLYEGKDCIGKKLLALYTARGFLCEKKEDFGCGVCNDCKLVNNLISNVYENTNLTPHPNIMLIQSNNREIKIDQIREAISFLSLKSSKGKVLIIEKAENLNTESANALLKTLEEPPSNTLIILTTSNQNQLLPTIVSRLKKIRFRKLSHQDVVDILSLKLSDEKKIKELADISDGSLCIASTLLKKEDIYVWAKDFVGILINKKHPEGIFSIAAKIDKMDIEDVNLFFDIIFKFYIKHSKDLKDIDNYQKFLNQYRLAITSLRKGVKKKLIIESFYFRLTQKGALYE
ncbi:MAG: DNA polymerase III subunit delta' [Sulfurihydrogenibium sp.]|jgi:DNA polymerase-3 subunit delta'|nr:DNA polymerase III subunit delta' [Sulfurihydrogenibium sp.]